MAPPIGVLAVLFALWLLGAIVFVAVLRGDGERHLEDRREFDSGPRR
jgi:hypothetical protein